MRGTVGVEEITPAAVDPNGEDDEVIMRSVVLRSSAPEPPKAELTDGTDDEEIGLKDRDNGCGCKNKQVVPSRQEEADDTQTQLDDDNKFEFRKYQPPLPVDGVFTENEKKLYYLAINFIFFFVFLLIGILVMYLRSRD